MRASKKISIHNLELDKYRKANIAQPASALQCWLTAICRAQDEVKSLTEVVKIDPILQKFYDIDPGFAQFIERHGKVSLMPELLKAYKRWEMDIISEKLDEEYRNAEIETRIAKGKTEERISLAKNMLLEREPIEKVAKYTGLALEEIKLFSG